VAALAHVSNRPCQTSDIRVDFPLLSMALAEQLNLEFSDVHERMAHAKGYCIAYVHTYLPAYPAGWIRKMKNDANFVKQYAAHQRGYTTLKVICATLLVAITPTLYARTVMPYPCNEENVTIREDGDEGWTPTILKNNNCGFEDWLRSPRSVSIGLTCAIGGYVAIPLAQRFWHIRNRLLATIQSQFPTMPYAGFGSAWSIHSAKVLMGDHYSWVHHFFGAPDLMVLLASMTVNLFAAFVALGLALHDVATSGVIGYAVARLFIEGMNFFLGTSPFTINMVRAELDIWSQTSTETQSKLDNACENIAARSERLGNKSLAAEIRKSGPHLLQVIGTVAAQANTRGLVLRIFDNPTLQHIYMTEEEMAAFCMIDPHSFLVSYFDPDLETFRWERNFTLRSIYNPVSDEVLVLQDGRWRLVTA